MKPMRRDEEAHLKIAYATMKGVIIKNDIPELNRICHLTLPAEERPILIGVERVRKFFLILEPKATPRIELHIENEMGHDMIIFMSSVYCPAVAGVSNNPFRKILSSVFVEKLVDEKAVATLEYIAEQENEEMLKELKPMSFSQIMSNLESAAG